MHSSRTADTSHLHPHQKNTPGAWKTEKKFTLCMVKEHNEIHEHLKFSSTDEYTRNAATVYKSHSLTLHSLTSNSPFHVHNIYPTMRATYKFPTKTTS
jgi:hypothetical protein